MRPKYKDKRTERFAAGERVKEFQTFEKQAYKRRYLTNDFSFLGDGTWL